MDPYVIDWLNLLARWAHMIAGIAWIGTSFYFVALDFSLQKPDGLPSGVSGEAWEVHGGGFYNVSKYLSAPPRLPEGLIGRTTRSTVREWIRRRWHGARFGFSPLSLARRPNKSNFRAQIP